MINPGISQRYAKALIDLSIERQLLEQVYDDMNRLESICKSNPDFRHMLNNPLIRNERKIKVIHALFKDSLQPLTLKYMELLIRKRRESHLDEISKAFNVLYREHKNIRLVYVSSVVPLEDKTRTEIKNIVAGDSGADVRLIEKIDPSLIGGLIIKIDNTLFDDSVRRKLKDLRKEFSSNVFKGSF
ncbi:MAG: ATP synthase F1 subunit delta [Lentimicrobiaceae bacterium]|jgi:F-type H+-transporting ATPase subunit delta|nr:ATP synthase F1 subunit delta [Lentimicrobiaceae bacterium]MDD4598937.1 ATP synthase F1 subunit delta [Lentimicrobiaceae bacterium]MDY0026486.1 ATP synthase F1 subunit delta [Lentimicrobium sp.]HAH60068.1 ATP synthase F1 subunit delta [Bacteroidales bacterium]